MFITVCQQGEDETEPDAEPEDDEDGSFMVPHGYLSEGEGCEDEDDDRVRPDFVYYFLIKFLMCAVTPKC